MTITFKLYASARDTLKTNTLSLEVEDIHILYAYVNTLQNKYPEYNFNVCRFAKGNKYIKLADVVHDGDIISIIPPISGG
jgi:molybdopterin converting factor small subunit